MRWYRLLRASVSTQGEADHELAGRLLVAAMLIPLVEAVFGWRAHTPLDVPLAVHTLLLTAMIVLSPPITPAERDEAGARRAVRWFPVPLAAIALAVLLNARSNAFYTARALMEGMSLLLTLHLARSWLRQCVVTRRAVSLVAPARPSSRRLRLWWSRCGAVPVPASTPAVRVSDALATIVGWSLLLSWLLIALAHRHIAGPILILAGALQAMALVVLIPDALSCSKWVAGVRVGRRLQPAHPDHLTLVRGALPRERHAGLHLRRR